MAKRTPLKVAQASCLLPTTRTPKQAGCLRYFCPIGFLAAFLALFTALSTRAADDFQSVAALFRQHCFDCHVLPDAEGNYVMETHAALLKGGDTGAAVVPGKASESLLVKYIEGFEADGKKKIMPPGKRDKLSTDQIALIRKWIDAGATMIDLSPPKETALPAITPRTPPKASIASAAYSQAKNLLALAKPEAIELRAPETRALVRSMPGPRGKSMAVVFSKDGSRVYGAGGRPGIAGELFVYNTADGALIRKWEGHSDTIYSLALSPDGKILATGSYDQTIKFWNAETGEEIRTLEGHNGCVFDLDFRADGRILASASADRTVKLWDVASGERRDTLTQSLKELYTVTFSPDGKRLAAAGVDNRIRIWEISESAAETTNPLLHSRFAHDKPLLRLAYSRDGKSIISSAEDAAVKVWTAADVSEKFTLPAQPDWAPALAALPNAYAVGRLDGTFEVYDAKSGGVVPLPKPELARIEPRGIQSGNETRVKVFGKHLSGITSVKAHAKIQAEIESGDGSTERWIKITPAADLPRGSYDIALVSPQGETAMVKLHVDSLAHIYSPTETAITLPAVIWASHDKPGDVDIFKFSASAGQTIVLDANAKSVGSKAEVALTLRDARGRTIATQRKYDGAPDPFMTVEIKDAGDYALEVSEFMPAGSAEHFYRVIVGALPYVTAISPVGAKVGAETDFTLIGYNLGTNSHVRHKAEKEGAMTLPLPDATLRVRGELKFMASAADESAEAEPNDSVARAALLSVGASISGVIHDGSDADIYKFEAKKGQALVLETTASMIGSPADTKLEVLDAQGKLVERVILQAVRDSAITFRPMDSVQSGVRLVNWEEMELREYVYLQGDVARIFRAPQGPDSDSLFFILNGKRRAYFDTTATAHALDEPAFIVEPLAPGAKLPNNGLPRFTVYFENDDDGERKLGTDSKVYFTAPADGSYFVRVTDGRGAGSNRHLYRLTVRDAKPDYTVGIAANSNVPEGSGQSFTVNVERFDGFDGPIRVDISDVPSGFVVSSPVIVEADHSEARGTIFAPAGASVSEGTPKALASAMINGAKVEKSVGGIGKLTRAGKPKLLVSLLPAAPDATAVAQGAMVKDGEPLVITIAPGQTIPAMIRTERNGHDDLITFTVDNLPHGVIVDNIGLNGVLIPKEESEREIFLTAAKWVEEMDRLCFAIENQAGRQTSRPVLLRVRKSAMAAK